MQILVGPSGSGRTERLLNIAREALATGRRVGWIGLPAQRSAVLHRLTRGTATLGFEFLNIQQIYYQVLVRGGELRTVLRGSARLAIIAQALAEVRGRTPTPGEAKLFGSVISEVKRYGVPREELPESDPEARVFKAVLEHYEVLKDDAWDYEDYRLQALEHARVQPVVVPWQTLILDGVREVNPRDLELLELLGRQLDVWVSLPQCPEGFEAAETLPPRAGAVRQVFKHANVVAEARWVLRSVKCDLAGGIPPHELAVITPRNQQRALLALANEFGVPLVDEAPHRLETELSIRTFLDLLDLPDDPNPGRLVDIPLLKPLVDYALTLNLTGRDALTRAADEVGPRETLEYILGLLTVTGDELSWAEGLLKRLPDLYHPARQELLKRGLEQHRDTLLQKAREALLIAPGDDFRSWWAALIRDTQLRHAPPAGVSLLNEVTVSGRRFTKAYLTGAIEGAYGAQEQEDYFFPEEERQPLSSVLRRRVLPQRYQGRSALIHEELLHRAEMVVVTYPEAGPGGRLEPSRSLIGEQVDEPPDLPAGCRTDMTEPVGFKPAITPVTLAQPTVQQLAEYQICRFKVWADVRVGSKPSKPLWWWSFKRALCRDESLTEKRLEELKADFPEAVAWLEAHRERLMRLRYKREKQHDGLLVQVDAIGRTDRTVEIYRFTNPGERSESNAKEYFKRHWMDLVAAKLVLDAHPGAYDDAKVYLWPLLGEPLFPYKQGFTASFDYLVRTLKDAKQALATYGRDDITPTPEYNLCGYCTHHALCRVGRQP